MNHPFKYYIGLLGGGGIENMLKYYLNVPLLLTNFHTGEIIYEKFWIRGQKYFNYCAFSETCVCC